MGNERIIQPAHQGIRKCRMAVCATRLIPKFGVFAPAQGAGSTECRNKTTKPRYPVSLKVNNPKGRLILLNTQGQFGSRGIGVCANWL